MKPIMFGYVAMPAGMPDDAGDADVEVWRSRMAAFARLEGYTLGAVFADLRGRPESFYAMLERIGRDAATAVVVPGMAHLTHLRCLAGADGRIAARYLHARLFVLDSIRQRVG